MINHWLSKRIAYMNMLTLSLAFLLMCLVGEKHCCQVLKLILMQSTYFPNRFGRKSSTEGKQDFSIHGSCVSLYVNNAVLRQARVWGFVNSNHSLLHMSVPSVSHSWSSTVSSSISDTGRLLDPPHPNKEAVRKLSLLPSDNDKMMTGLWPWLDNAIVYRRAVGKQRA